MNLSVHTESWQAVRPFRISGHEWRTFETVVVELARDDACGRGEALGVFYAGETASSMAAQIDAVSDRICDGLDRTDLQALLPPGGARCAVDCALWDLEAKSAGRRIWDLAGVTPRVLETVFTIGMEASAAAMAEKARAATAHQLLKIKLDASAPLERVRAIRLARPDARLVVDVNQSWNFGQLVDLAPALAELGVLMIEQPLARGEDAALESYRSPVPLCADESCMEMPDIDVVQQRYQMINIKLDKTGGLTLALELARAARARGLGLMVGCMGGTSLAMAPSFVVGCLCDFVDIDGPLLLRRDRLPGITYDGGFVRPFPREVWG